MTFSLANACLVIDEIDFYDQFTQFNIFILLSILKCWEVPILIMSASLPDTVKEDYNALGYGIKNILEDTSDYERPRFRICDLKDSEGPEDMEELLRLCLKEKSAIIYANTVDRAQTYYQWFLDNKRKEDVVLYHSRFTELDKKNKENLLLKRLGHGAWREGRAHGIAILTQIGEMSVNISADLMVSDLCPIDRLTQRCGRLCRFSTDKVGSLYIICPLRNGKLFAAPYYKNIEGKKKLLPNEVYNETRGLYFPKINIKEPTFEVNMNITGTHFLLLSRLQAKAVTLCGRYYDDAYFRKQDHTRNKKN